MLFRSREVPWDGEVEEFSAPSDLFTLNYRRCFLELMRRGQQMDQNKDQGLEPVRDLEASRA